MGIDEWPERCGWTLKFEKRIATTEDHAIIGVYDETGNLIDTPEHTGEFKEP